MNRSTRNRLAGLVLSVALLAAACTPTPATPVPTMPRHRRRRRRADGVPTTAPPRAATLPAGKTFEFNGVSFNTLTRWRRTCSSLCRPSEDLLFCGYRRILSSRWKLSFDVSTVDPVFSPDAYLQQTDSGPARPLHQRRSAPT
jgi:hypothetical protein